MSTYKLATKTRDERDIASGDGKNILQNIVQFCPSKREKKNLSFSLHRYCTTRFLSYILFCVYK